MKRINTILLIGLLICCTLCGCTGKGEGNTLTGRDTADIVLKAGFSTGTSDPRVVATELFAKEVEEATDGRIRVEIHADGELGADPDLISGIVNGDVDITASSAGNFANYDVNVGVSALPFQFDDFDDAWEFVDGDIEKLAEEDLVNNNIRVLAHYDNGFRCVTTSDRVGPVNSISDMQGIVIRTPENKIVMQTMLLLGAEPKVLDFTALKDALRNGEFDAQENPVPVIYNNGLYEVQSNLAITNHSYDVMLFVIREDIWESLSDSDKEIISNAAKKAEAKDRELIRSQTKEYIHKLEEEGMTVTYPDLDEFKKATEPAYEELLSGYDEEILNRLRH